MDKKILREIQEHFLSVKEKKQRKMKSNLLFLVIGSNNFLYSVEMTRADAIFAAKDVKKETNGYSDPETGWQPNKPEFLNIYKAKFILEVR